MGYLEVETQDGTLAAQGSPCDGTTAKTTSKITIMSRCSHNSSFEP